MIDFYLKRFFDLFFSLICIIIFFLPFIFLYFFLFLSSDGPVLFWSKRVGKNNKIFMMPKFRTMKVDAPVVATNFLNDPKMFLTPIGSFLRKSSLDEVPQIWSILLGDMSFVGPRPALFNQYDLIKLRKSKKIHFLTPGLTGWAQVNGRDNLSISKKV
jgi:O-antigen biosynthesis protein WbqP